MTERAASALRLAVITAVTVLLAGASTASASGSKPAWSIRALAQPTSFSAASTAECVANRLQACDSYTIFVTNVGTEAADGSTDPVTISDRLPEGIRLRPGVGFPAIVGEDMLARVAENVHCTEAFAAESIVQCVDAAQVPVGDTLRVTLEVVAEPGAPASVTDVASVAGGGAPSAATQIDTPVGTAAADFGLDFSLSPLTAQGLPDVQAADHPNSITAGFTLNTNIVPTVTLRSLERGTKSEDVYVSPEEPRDVIVDLPNGTYGNPAATPKCPLDDLLLNSGTQHCPPASRIGTAVFEAGRPAEFRISSEDAGTETTAIYNMQPEAGYPAEFGLTYLGKPIFMYASTIRGRSGGYGLRVSAAGIPRIELIAASLTFFGEPAIRDDGRSSTAPFLTNPADCSGGPLSARVEVDTWQDPGVYHATESVVYPRVTGCGALQFEPSLGVTPETSRMGAPSGYRFEVGVPQRESEFGVTPGTPPLKDVSVTLPAGVSASPSFANGLVACPATGPEGINLGSSSVEPGGRDVGDPEATELGEGHAGGDGSPYDDGLYHSAPGRCPAASTVGSVEVATPLLAEPLRGHLYLAQPQCGGAGQEPCGEADAADGKLVGLYLEVSGSGVIIKLAGSTSIDPATGRITASFRQNPQLPFSKLTVRLKGGPDAALANPLSCGVATTTADLSAWSTPFTPHVTPASSFAVDWDSAGGPCPAALPFEPGLSGTGMVDPSAGSFSAFTFTLQRGDQQQTLSQVGVRMPPGLLGMLSSVALCGEPQAAQGTCGSASEIGTTTVAAGPGSSPFWTTGHVFLTAGYKGAPFGLSIVVPAKAGPFNLGDVVVRGAINVDPATGAITVTSDPFPQILDGIPLRLQTVNVTVDRPGFMFNPTSCAQQQITTTIVGGQGATAQPSSPFAASHCRALSFKPVFTAATHGNGTKRNGAALTVRIASHQGPGSASQTESNIRKVDVQLPIALPSRLTTLQKACTERQFALDPAGCPAASAVGYATAHTPVLPVPLIGPAYLVSHGGEAFPDLVIILQGDGVRIDLTGRTEIVKGHTYSRFETSPDAPVESFELRLPEGPYSILGAYGSLCARTTKTTVTMHVTRHVHGRTIHTTVKVSKSVPAPLQMPTTITAQDGAVLKQVTKITNTGCPTAKKARTKTTTKATTRGRGA
jgi:hypothetical protein